MTERSRVNHKLYFARLLLDQAAQADEANLREALLQGALLHLITAYRSYLAEIAVSYQHSAAANSAVEAALQLPSCPELAELAALEQGGGWAGRLLQAWQQCTATFDRVPTSPESTTQPGTIATADITHQLDCATCRSWHEAFQKVVTAQRERLQEW